MARSIETESTRVKGERLYRASDGDMLDDIAWRYYGKTSTDTVVAILERNKGLCEHGLVLSAGVEIILPVIQTYSDNTEYLWDRQKGNNA